MTGMFVSLVPPVSVTFDELFHFDFTVKPRRQNVYYFLRIEVVAFDLQHPEVNVPISWAVGAWAAIASQWPSSNSISGSSTFSENHTLQTCLQLNA